jgi:hypothetical protein
MITSNHWVLAIIGLLACLVTVQAHADSQRNAQKDVLISRILERFWGHAIDSKGALIQPSSDLDRRTVPIPFNVAYRALEAGEISGLAEWCGLDWKSHYFSLTAAARQHGMSDKQVAFISVLHGAMQGGTLASKASPCAEGDRSQISETLEVSRKQGLEAPDESLERTGGV